jgi:hypothetical protein
MKKDNTVLQLVALVATWFLAYGVASWLMGCGGSPTTSGASSDAGREAGTPVRDAGDQRDAHEPHEASAPDVGAVGTRDAADDVGGETDLRDAAGDARTDAPHVLQGHDGGPSCFGFRDGGYLALTDGGFAFPAGDAAPGAACIGFGCWYACEAGPCLQSSTCEPGTVCIVSADASTVTPDDVPGTCEVQR